jgi:uncharacterized protein YecT (DUF1311 family)
MTKLIVAFFTILFSLTSSVCFGRDNYQLYDEFYKCTEEAEGVFSFTCVCIDEETERQDKKLNQAYKLLIADYPDDLKLIIRDVQRAWISYRDLKCGFFRDVDSGTMGTMNTKHCFMVETARRAQELESLIGY